MKIFVPFVRVTAVEGKTVHDICFVDTTDRKPVKGGVDND